MSVQRFGQIILAATSLLLVLCLLWAGSFFLYRKAQGQSTEEIVNSSVDFLLEHLPIFGNSSKQLHDLDNPLTVLPAKVSTYQEFATNKLPRSLTGIVQTELQDFRQTIPTTSFSVATLATTTGSEQVESLIYFLPYTLSEQEAFTDYLNKTWPNPTYTFSPERLAGYELYLLSSGEEQHYYLLRLASNYLAMSDSKQALAKLLQTRDGQETLAQEIKFPEQPATFYRAYSDKQAPASFWQSIFGFLSFNQAEYALRSISGDDQELELQQELYGTLIAGTATEPRLASLTPRDILFYFEAQDLSQVLIPLLGSLQTSDSKLSVNDWLNELERQSGFDLEKDFLSWTKQNFSLSALPTSDPSLFTYAFSLMVEVDEREEAQTELIKLDQALEQYFNTHKPDQEAADVHFVDQTLGDLKLRSLPLYPELGLHYTFLDDQHLLFSTHLEGIEAYSKVRSEKDSLATLNDFEQALTKLKDPQTINYLFWQLSDSSEFLLYLFPKYWPGLDLTLAKTLLPEIDNLTQLTSNKVNFLLTKAVLNY